MKQLQIPLEEGKFYHIFNRGNNGDLMFYKPTNYEFFLRRLDEYLSPYVEVYAFCLLPNHFHLLIRVREQIEALHPEDAPRKALHLEDARKKALHLGDARKKALHLEDAKLLKKDAASQAFHRLFTSFSKAINKQENRHGSLIENPFKRKEVNNTRYLSNLVFYIHANPQLHGICDDFRDYPWSSYQRLINGKPSKLNKLAVLEWFSDADNYIAYHAQQIKIAEIRELILE